MQKAFSLPRLFFFESAKNKRSISQTSPLNLMLSSLFIALNVFLLGSFLSGINSNSSKGYEIKKLQNNLSLLAEENNKLNVKLAEDTSMVAIQTDFLNANFVSAGTPIFLEGNQYSQR